MAWWNPFSWGKKKAKQQPYQGPKPFSSLKEIPETGEYLKTLQDRMRGLNVGIPQSVLDAYEGPLAKQAFNLYGRYEAPAVSASASARGVGRSTIPVNVEARGRREVGESLDERLARLRIANEELKRQEIQQGITGVGGYIGAEAGQRGKGAAFNYQEFLRQQGIQETNRLEANQQAAQLQALIGTALTGKDSGIADIAMGDYGKSSTSDLTTMLQLLQGGGGAGVNVAKGKAIPTNQSFLGFRKYLREPTYSAQTGSAYAV